MLDLIYLDLTMCQAQYSVGLTRMLDLRCLYLIISQVQNNYRPPMACLGEWPTSIRSNLEEEVSLYKFSYTWRLKLYSLYTFLGI